MTTVRLSRFLNPECDKRTQVRVCKETVTQCMTRVCQLAIFVLYIPCYFFSIAWCPGGFLNSSETDINTVTDPFKTSVNSEETSDFGNWYY
jgi:hypothetical protein